VVTTPLTKRLCCPITTLQAAPDKLWQDLKGETPRIDEHIRLWWPSAKDPLFQWPEDDLAVAAQAAITGNLPLLAHMHEQHIDIHERTPAGNSLITLAAMGGQLETIHWLYSLGLDIHHRNAAGTDALMSAAAYGHTDVIEWLVENGVSLGFMTQRTDRNGNDALMYAAHNGQFEAAKLLIALGAQPNPCNHSRVNALMLAANSGDRPLVKLLSENCNVNDRARSGWCAIHFAAGGGHLDIIKLLCRRGANIEANTEAITMDGYNVYTLAAASGSLNTLHWLHRYTSAFRDGEVKCDALIAATRAGHLPIITFLVPDTKDDNAYYSTYRSRLGYDSDSDDGSEDVSNSTLTFSLTLAACRGYLDCVQYLYTYMYRYARDALPDGENDTPLVLLAAGNDNLDMLQWCEQQGADLHKVDKDGRNALLFAAQGGCLATVQWLHAKRVNMHLKDNSGMNAVDLAASHGYFDVAKWLHSENVDTPHKENMLFDAVRWSQLSAVQWLSGIVDLQCLDPYGRDCLTYSILFSSDETPKGVTMIRWLYQQGLSVSWQHLHNFLSKDFFLDSSELGEYGKARQAYFYRKKLTEMLTYEDPGDLKNRITVAGKRNLLRIFNIDCTAFDEDQLDKKLLSFKRT